MAIIINLRQARKAKKRAENGNRAVSNRLKHGRTKAEKLLMDMDKQKHEAVIGSALRERVED